MHAVRPAAGMRSAQRPINELDYNGVHYSDRSRVAADQVAHGWSAGRGRYVLAQPEQRAFEQQHRQALERQQQQPPRASTAPPNFDGLQQRAALRAQPVGGRLQYGPNSGSHLEERQREYTLGASSAAVLAPQQPAPHQPPQRDGSHRYARVTTADILRDQQRQERQEVEERRQRAQVAKAEAEATERAERRQHQDQYQRMLEQRWQADASPARVAPADFAWRNQPRDLRASALTTKEARVNDWIRGANPSWDEQQSGQHARPQPQGPVSNAVESPGVGFRQLSRRTPSGAAGLSA